MVTDPKDDHQPLKVICMLTCLHHSVQYRLPSTLCGHAILCNNGEFDVVNADSGISKYVGCPVRTHGVHV